MLEELGQTTQCCDDKLELYTCKLTRPETDVLKYSLLSKKEGKPSHEEHRKTDRVSHIGK